MVTTAERKKKSVSVPNEVDRRARKPVRRAAADRKTVLLLGSGPRARRVRELIRRLGISCVLESSPRSFLEQGRSDVSLIVTAPPLPDLSVEEFCRRLRARSNMPDVPIFVVGMQQRKSERLYRAGASGQFDWPAERAALIRAVLRLAGPGAKAGGRNGRDVALAARVEERLKAERDTFGPAIGVRVQRGVVLLSGEVDAAWKISELRRTLAEMPSVEDVVTTGVLVPLTEIPDRVVARSVRTMLRHAAGLEHRTFAVRVLNGRVTLAGTARSRREADRIVDLVEHVSGVRAVERLITVSQVDQRRNRKVVSALTRLVRRHFPKSKVDLSVFGGFAILAGKANGAAERRAIESLIAGQPGVDHVVNKLS